jgi:citrate lyase subunit beta / citryl-CoA lyase
VIGIVVSALGDWLAGPAKRLQEVLALDRAAALCSASRSPIDQLRPRKLATSMSTPGIGECDVVVTLVVPGSSERMLIKVRTIAVDEIVIDLEDAVIPPRRPEALRNVLLALAGEPFAAAQVTVRINAVGSPWAHEELIGLVAASAQLDGVVVPKVESGGDLAFAERLLAAEAAAGSDSNHQVKLQALIETSRGPSNLDEIVTVSARLQGVILGYADLSVSLGRSPTGRDNLDNWLAVQERVLVAARATGIRASDGPHLLIGDADGLDAAAHRAADLGFDGKWAIHPSQLEPIRTAFAPSAEQIDHARMVLDALAQAAGTGGGAVRLEGEMLDKPARLAALRTLARAGASAGGEGRGARLPGGTP